MAWPASKFAKMLRSCFTLVVLPVAWLAEAKTFDFSEPVLLVLATAETDDAALPILVDWEEHDDVRASSAEAEDVALPIFVV